ncbi:RND transporter [Pseudonocardia sp. H11422]|uniref:RND transporter n=1 Tax=Pseudonocardia sp. H11422 TaxID=2835866 RepID=UPI002027E197|nr:RND transporter [Pseudonocardia sp. H11422]
MTPWIRLRRAGETAWSAGRRMLRRRPSRRGWLTAVLVLGLTAGVVGGLAQLRVDTGTDSFLPAGDASLAAVEQKARSFGGDPVVVLLQSREPRQLLLDQQQLLSLLRAEGTLAALPDVAAVYGPATVLNQIATTAQNLLAQIAGRRDGLRIQAEQQAREAGASEQGVRRAVEQATREFDLRYGSLVVQGLPAGVPTLYSPNFIRTVAFDQSTGEPRPQWRFVLPAPDTVAILVRPREGLDQAGTQRLVEAVRGTVEGAGLATRTVTVTGVPAVTAGLAGQVTAELPLLGLLVAIAVALRFLLVPGAGRRTARLWPLAAALLGTTLALAVFGWLHRPLSFGSVAMLPLLLGIGSTFPLYLAALRNRRRVVVMAVASAGGFAALAVSPLPFVRELGLALALGVLCTVAAALLLRRGLADRIGPDPIGTGPTGAEPEARPRPRWGRRSAVLVVLTAVAGLGWAMLPRLAVEADPLELARGLPQLEDALVAEQVLGSSGEVSIRLSGPDVVSPEALAWARRAEAAVIAEHGGDVRPVLTLPSLLAFLGDAPTAEQIDAALELFPSYLRSAAVTSDRRSALMIFGLEMRDLGAQNQLLQDVRDVLPPPPSGYSADLVGLPVAAGRGYELISEGRYLANLAGIAVAGVVLAVGLRRRTDAMRATATALLATGWGLAIIWSVDGSLSPLTVALGSLVTVTGCEFLVLLAEARRGDERWLHRSVAFACLTSVIGYLALAASQLWLVREFGLVLTVAVLLSYLAAIAVMWLFPPGRRPAAGSGNTRENVRSASGTEVTV